MNKKLMTLLVVVCTIACTLFSCGKKEAAETNKESVDTKKIKVVTTIFAPFDFARQVAGDKADVTMLLAPGAESHSFEPSPQDIIKIQQADVFVYVGGENDAWVDRILNSFDHNDMKIIKLLDCVSAVEEETVEGMQEHDHDHEDADHDHEDADHKDDHEHEDADHEDEHHEDDHKDEAPEYDEHVWTSPKNAIAISAKMKDVFSEADQVNAAVYQENQAAYQKKLEELDGQFKEVVANATRKTFVFGDRFPLRYFADAYGLKYYAAFSGCSTDTEASASTIAFLTDKVKADKIPVVFKIELSNGNIANSISEATGAKVLTFYACHNLSKDDFEAGMTYVDYMKKNVESLREALN